MVPIFLDYTPRITRFRHWSYTCEINHYSHIFQEECIRDTDSGQLYGLEKFWAFIKYYRHATELHVMPKLKDMLEPFKTIEDFKIYYTVRNRAPLDKVCTVSKRLSDSHVFLLTPRAPGARFVRPLSMLIIMGNCGIIACRLPQLSGSSAERHHQTKESLS